MQDGIIFLLCFCEFVLVDSRALDYFLWYKTILCYVNNYKHFLFIYSIDGDVILKFQDVFS